MAHFLCECGFSFPVSTENGENKLEIIPGRSRSGFFDLLLDAHRQATDDENFRRRVAGILLDRRKPLVYGYECPNCGRLAIGTGGNPGIAMRFVRDPDFQSDASSIGSLADGNE
jgi:hypothetical protein